MAQYGNLNYTTDEINIDLAKVHDKTAVADEAPKDGKEYVRKDGVWVESQTGNINAILDNINGEVV